jgi:hypothetical protein
MRTEQTKVVLICDNCRITSEQREKSTINQTWFTANKYPEIISLYSHIFCTESCGKIWVEKHVDFTEIPKNTISNLLRPTDKYREIIGNTD